MGNISKIRIQNTDYAIKDSRLPDGTSSQFVKGDGSLDSTSYVSSTNAVKNGDFILTNNANLTADIKQRVYDRSLQDTFFAANSRFVVTHKRYSSTDDSFINNLSTDIFKGTFGYYLNTVLDGEYGVLYIGNVAEDELSSTTTAANGIFTYPNGKIFMTFYASMRCGEILEAKGWFRNDTTWRNLTVVANNTNVYEIQVPNVNYLKAVRIKYSGSNLGSEGKTSLSDVAYIRYRDDFSERNLITKYPTSQRMYGNLTAPKFITSGGTSSQFVKGDGTLDSNTYLTSSSLSTYAPLASPALTGTPTAPTAEAGTNTTQIATTEFVQSTLHESTATYDITLNGTKAEGWYRVAKLGRTFSGIVSMRGTYASTLSTVATFSISGRASNVACDIIQLSGEVQGNISKIRLVSGENSDTTFYLDIYKATSGNISATYLTFNGTFETLEDATSTTVLDTASTYVRKVCDIQTITNDMYVTTSTFNNTVGDIETLLAAI